MASALARLRNGIRRACTKVGAKWEACNASLSHWDADSVQSSAIRKLDACTGRTQRGPT